MVVYGIKPYDIVYVSDLSFCGNFTVNVSYRGMILQIQHNNVLFSARFSIFVVLLYDKYYYLSLLLFWCFYF